MKIILKLLLAFICVVTALVGYEVYFPWEDKARERTFHQRLEEKVAAGETKIYLRDLTDFEWDQVCSHAGYSDVMPEKQSRLVPVGYELIGRIPYIHDDGAWALEFQSSGAKAIRFYQVSDYSYMANDFKLVCFSSAAFLRLHIERSGKSSFSMH